MVALKEECQDADILFGANSLIPLPVFQTIMKDYDLPMISTDIEDFKRRGLMKADSQKNYMVFYKDVLNFVAPAATVSSKGVIDAVVKIQKVWRGRIARKMVGRIRNESEAI